VRLIAGSLKGRRLLAPDPGDPRVRPTADRAREALFSILQRWPQGPFLDLYAGTGAVALEAWSRGYTPVACVEREPLALACIKQNARGTDLQVLAKDVQRLPKDAFPPQAVLFADPPYEASLPLWEAMAPRIKDWLRPDGVLVWETGHPTGLPAPEGLALVESRRYGAAVFHFFNLA
jgi:16S rRNA (guanine966-N2)-methyltransferase